MMVLQDLKSIILYTLFRISRSTFGSLGPSVVKVGQKYVIKGLCNLPEIEALCYISGHTTIPVPQIHYTYNGPGGIYIIMECIPGTNLQTLWMRGRLEPKEKENIVNDMVAILTQLRTLTPPKEGVVTSAQGGAILDYWIGG
ncbi:hypothetical protein BDFG_06662 [Blastomyces dermatitidis ATCC 26199]|nr:hypothetical protein BDFG_06662 [Blastomyces dermatitidis ATCC 26199]